MKLDKYRDIAEWTEDYNIDKVLLYAIIVEYIRFVMVEIKGKIHDLDNQPLAGVIIEAFERAVFSNLDRILAPAEVSNSTGSFKIVSVSGIQPDIQKIYLVITDTNKKYSSIKDGQSRFSKVIDFQGNVKWKSESLDVKVNGG